MKNSAIILMVVWMLLGCGATTMTKSGPRAAPRGPQCDFSILTAYPEGYAEIGSIDVEPGAYGSNMFTTLPEFKKHIQPHVCEAGGEAAVALPNGYGMYIKATVLKKLPGGVSEAGGPPNSSGCQNDSQCKGNRICEAGRCVSP
jgi:hypothetical protein